jgi:hypothetical protein
MNRTVSGSSIHSYEHDALLAFAFLICRNLVCSVDRAHKFAWWNKNSPLIGLCLLLLRVALTGNARGMDNARYYVGIRPRRSGEAVSAQCAAELSGAKHVFRPCSCPSGPISCHAGR